MKQSILLFGLLGLVPVAIAGPSNPKDPSSNPYTKVESALLAPLLPPADPMVKVGFSNAIDSGPAFKITNYSVRQTSPELGAGTPGGQLEDVDGDGDLDMVFAKNREIIAYENKGTAGAPLYSAEPVDLVTVGFFESGGTNLIYDDSWDVNVVFADLDGDGNRDMVCSEAYDGQVTCFFRQSSGPGWPAYGPQKRTLQDYGTNKHLIEVSTDESSFWFDLSIASVAVEDLDNDGHVDLIVGDPDSLWSQPMNVQVYRGTGEFEPDGSPIFQLPVPLKAGGSPIIVEWTYSGATCPVFHDIDGDGDKDLMVSTTEGRIWTFKANGRDMDAASNNFGFPIFQAGETLKDISGNEINPGEISALSVCDYSGDGDSDLAMVSTGEDQLEENRFRILENVGGGGLQFSGLPLPIGVGGHEAELRTSYVSKSAYFDFDGDGKVDVIFAGEGYGLAIAYNISTGNDHHPLFAAPLILPLVQGTIDQLEEGVPDIVDFDNNGQMDPGVDGLLVGTKTGLLFLKYSGTTASGLPTFDPPVSILPAGFPALHFIQPAAGDLNGDGKLDVVLVAGGMYSGETRSLLLLANGAVNQFSLAAPTPVLVNGIETSSYMFPELVDFDGDGDLDLLVSGRSPSFNRRAIATGNIRFLRNNGGTGPGITDQGLIEVSAGVPMAVTSDASVRSVDFNGGGKTDLLLSAANSSVTPFLTSATAPGTMILPTPASPILKTTATLASSVGLSNGGKQLEIAFPAIVHVGNLLDLNELYVGGQRASITGIVIDFDTDGDGLGDAQEAALGTDPTKLDTDGDGLSDAAETTTDPLNPDTDGDGFPDSSDPLPNQNDFLIDPDGKGLAASYATGLIGRWDFETLVPSSTPNDFAYGLNRFQDSTANARHAGTFGVGLDQLGMPSKGAIATTRGFMAIPASLLNNRAVYTVSLWARLPADAISTDTANQHDEAGIFSNHDYVQVASNAAFLQHNINALSIHNVGTNEILRAGAYHWSNYKIVNGTAVAANPVISTFDGIEILRPKGTFTDDQWHHYLYVCNDAYTDLYIDGVFMGHSQHVPADITLNGINVGVSVGRLSGKALGTTPYQVTSTGGVLKGSIDRLRVWSRALGQADATTLFHQDISGDGLWDITGVGTRLWRDTNSNAIVSADEFSFVASPFKFFPPETDNDGDGATDLAEQAAKTYAGFADSDGDLLPDGWELAHGLDPLNPNGVHGAAGNPDLDAYTNLDEYRDNTDPQSNTSGGQPNIPADEQMSIYLAVGDRSGSESEDYVMNCFEIDPVSGAENRIYTLRSGGFGQYKEETKNIFRKGRTYTFQLAWQGSKLTSRPASPGVTAEGPDFDYTFKVQPQGNHGGILIDSWDTTTGNLDMSNAILAEDASDVVQTQEEFRTKFENRRVVLTALDVDIVHPATGELADNLEATGRGGIVAIEGSTTTPKTKLRLQKNAWLKRVTSTDNSNTPVITMSFFPEGRFQIKAGATTVTPTTRAHANGDQFDYDLRGLKINTGSHNPDQVYVSLAFGSESFLADTLIFSTVKAEFDVYFEAYIPYDWVAIKGHPLHNFEVAGGDDRAFVPLSLEYRLHQHTRICPYPELSSTGFSSGVPANGFNVADMSRHYDKVSSLPDALTLADHQGNDPTNRLYVAAKQEEETEEHRNAPYKTNWGRANVDRLAVTKTSGGIISSFKFKGAASEPIVELAADIDWDMDYYFDTTVPNAPTCRIAGNHDGFPAYQSYAYSSDTGFQTAGRTDLIDWTPPLANNVLDLVNGPDTPLAVPAKTLK